MQKIKVTYKPTVELDLTADDWSLYSRGSEVAERALVAEMMNRQIETAINSSSSIDDAMPAINRVLNIFSKYGAADTEGQAVVLQILKQAYPGAAL